MYLLATNIVPFIPPIIVTQTITDTSESKPMVLFMKVDATAFVERKLNHLSYNL